MNVIIDIGILAYCASLRGGPAVLEMEGDDGG